MWSDLMQNDWVKHDEEQDGEAEVLAAAARFNDLSQMRELLSKYSQQLSAVLINRTTLQGKPLLHYAAENGQLEMIKLLISYGAHPGVRNQLGRTALHEAVRAGQPQIAEELLRVDTVDGAEMKGLIDLAYNSVATLTQTGTLVDAKDSTALTPILILAETCVVTEPQFVDLVKILLQNGADINQRHPASGQNALYRAVELGFTNAIQELVQSGISIDHKDNDDNTVVHSAARLGLLNILQYLLQCSKKSINEKNSNGDTPLHLASRGGYRDCIKTLLNFGGDISAENNEWQSVLETIFCNIHQPDKFFLEILDSRIIPNQYSINKRQFELSLDFRILCPDRENQMSVVVAFINSLENSERKEVFQHPLVDTYMRFKWSRFHLFFFIIAFVHLTFVLSFSIHITWLLHEHYELVIIVSRRILLVNSTIMLIYLIMQVYLVPKYFLREMETWISLVSVVGAFVMSSFGEVYPRWPEKWWFNHVTAYCILLSWCQVMFIFSRFPAIGFYSVMFFAVFKNVVKVLIIFACLVIGFALSFCMQFNHIAFTGAWHAIVKTTVMMMGEYNYDDLFPMGKSKTDVAQPRWDETDKGLAITSHFIFVLFILLGSIVLVNLMIGLAVNDIQALQEEGNVGHMMKQAAFLHHMDKILGYIPRLRGRTNIPSVMTFNPSTRSKVNESVLKRFGLSIPPALIDSLTAIAIRNQETCEEIRKVAPTGVTTATRV